MLSTEKSCIHVKMYICRNSSKICVSLADHEFVEAGVDERSIEARKTRRRYGGMDYGRNAGNGFN